MCGTRNVKRAVRSTIVLASLTTMLTVCGIADGARLPEPPVETSASNLSNVEDFQVQLTRAVDDLYDSQVGKNAGKQVTISFFTVQSYYRL
jgi:hypothetical protein